MTWCNDAVGTFQCDQQYIRIRGNGYYTSSLTCHETGHAVGLLHGDLASPKLGKTNKVLGCMTTPVQSEVLGKNQIENINGRY